MMPSRLLCVAAMLALGHSLQRIPMHKIKRDRPINARAVGEYLKQKYAPKHRFNVLAYSENITNFGNIEYYGIISIGTPPQEFKMALDTTDANVWMPCSTCPATNIACDLHAKFDCAKSSTCTNTDADFLINRTQLYRGKIYTDIVCLGTEGTWCTNRSQGFACLSEIPALTYAEVKYDGTFGLDWDINAINNISLPLTQIFSNTALCGDQKLFAFWINRNSTQSGRGGEMTVCGMDPNHYQGTIAWELLTSHTQWRINMQSLMMGSVSIVPTTVSAIVDSSLSFIVGICLSWIAINTTLFMFSGPRADVERIQRIIGGIELIAGSGEYYLNCDSINIYPNVVITLGGQDFILSAEDYVIKIKSGFLTLCYSGFFAHDLEDADGPLWLLGVIFIEKFYTVFDVGNRRIGFANTKI